MRIVTILVLFILFFSCKSKENNIRNNDSIGFPSETYDICLKEETDEVINLSSLCVDINYIPLETKKDCYISGVRSAIITDSHIVVRDLHKESLIVFNIIGEFIFRLDPTGKGPEEFLSIGDYSVNTVDNTISILDDKSRKIVNYSLIDGVFVEKIKIDRHWLHVDYFSSSNEMCINSPRPWFIRSNNSNFGILSGNSGIVAERLIPTQYSYAEPTEPLLWNSIMPYDRFLSFWESYIIDTIYLINRNLDFMPYVSFDFGSNEIPIGVLKDRAKYNSQTGMEYTQLVQYLLSSDYLFFTVLEHRTIKRYVFNKTYNFLYRTLGEDHPKTTMIYNDIDGGPGFWPLGLTTENELFQALNPLELLQNSKKLHNQSDKYLEILGQINESSNPIIQILKN